MHQIATLDVFTLEINGMGCTVEDHCYYDRTVGVRSAKCCHGRKTTHKITVRQCTGQKIPAGFRSQRDGPYSDIIPEPARLFA